MAKGLTKIQAAWDGWPKKSRHGWYFARYMKQRLTIAGRKDDYKSKQRLKREAGKQKGRFAMSLQDKIRAAPMFEITSMPDVPPVAQ